MQIVLARVEKDQEILRAGRSDLGEAHVYKMVLRPVSLMWLNDGTEDDVTEAKEYAKCEGYAVLCYDNEIDPLFRAKRDVLAQKL